MLRPVRVLLGFAGPNSTLTLEDDFVFFSMIDVIITDPRVRTKFF